MRDSNTWVQGQKRMWIFRSRQDGGSALSTSWCCDGDQAGSDIKRQGMAGSHRGSLAGYHA